MTDKSSDILLFVQLTDFNDNVCFLTLHTNTYAIVPDVLYVAMSILERRKSCSYECDNVEHQINVAEMDPANMTVK